MGAVPLTCSVDSLKSPRYRVINDQSDRCTVTILKRGCGVAASSEEEWTPAIRGRNTSQLPDFLDSDGARVVLDLGEIVRALRIDTSIRTQSGHSRPGSAQVSHPRCTQCLRARVGDTERLRVRGRCCRRQLLRIEADDPISDDRCDLLPPGSQLQTLEEGWVAKVGQLSPRRPFVPEPRRH